MDQVQDDDEWAMMMTQCRVVTGGFHVIRWFGDGQTMDTVMMMMGGRG